MAQNFKMKFVSMKGVEVYDKVKDVPYELNGFTEDLSDKREKGYIVHREELDNQPRFIGFLGPMWDGGMLRYETQQVYDLLSQ